MKTYHALILIALVSIISLGLLANSAVAQVSTGTGTNGKIPLWTGPHSQTNSVITQSSSKIGIGTTAPSSPLTVVNSAANAAINGRATSNGLGVRGDSVSGTAVYGFSTNGNAVVGSSVNKTGVYGTHTATTGTQPGVQGSTASTDAGSSGVYGIATKGFGLYGISTDGNGVKATSTNAFGITATSTNTYGAYVSSSHSDAADFSGADWGIYVFNTGAHPAVQGIATGANSYGGYFTSNSYRAGYFKSSNSGLYSLYVDSTGGPTQGTSALEVNGPLRAEGNFYCAGSKSGYVVDHMQNIDNASLETGDVVVIAADSGAPVLGQIPAPRIKLARSSYDSAVVGVVDEVMYVPTEATRFAYQAQQKADRDQAIQAEALSRSSETKVGSTADIPDRITDETGTLHADAQSTKATPGRYCTVVTLGAFKAVKVDANYGAIRAGDLLTTSPHAGYAMKVSDKVAASGAIIGKALSSLNSGVGMVSVLVTLK